MIVLIEKRKTVDLELWFKVYTTHNLKPKWRV